MSAYGLLITECEDASFIGRFYWFWYSSGIKVNVYSRDEAIKLQGSYGVTKYVPCRFTPALCKMLRKNPLAKYYGPVIK